MEVLKDYNSKFYLRVNNALITRTPKVVFVSGQLSRKATSAKLVSEDPFKVAEAFIHSAAEFGGDSLAIHLIKEALMAKTSILIVNMATLIILSKRNFEVEAKADVDANPDAAAYASKEEFDKLSVDQRCAIARPYLNDKEKDSTPDGEGFAAQSWKIANRFANAKPAKGEKQPAKDKPKKEVVPRAPGVKQKIATLFTTGDGPATLRLDVAEIMAKVEGTKSSVVTAISDLRTTKYGLKSGVVNLELIGGKYSLTGGDAATKAKEAQVAIDKTAADKKAEDKKAADEKKAAAKVETEKKAADKKTADAAAKKTADTAAKAAPAANAAAPA